MSPTSGDLVISPTTYRRILVDMHIPDWDPAFLGHLDPDALAQNCAEAGFARVLLDANSHTGLNFWPSSQGRNHDIVKQRDLFGELVGAVKGAGMEAHAYYCSIFVDWYWDEHPEARIVDVDGQARKSHNQSSADAMRFSLVCPNNLEYREFVLAQLRELTGNYPIDGFWLDMIFWPTVCYCASCAGRWAQEVGGELPRIVDWHDPVWLAFAERRRIWVAEYSALLESEIHGVNPQCKVIHQSIQYLEDWVAGGSVAMTQSTAALSADQYRAKEELSFNYKMFEGLRRPDPFEELASWMAPDIREHTVPRSPDDMELVAYLPIANGGAAGYIEAVDPSGDIAVERFRAAAPILHTIEDIEPHLGGRLLQDVGIYVSYESSFDLHRNNVSPTDYGYSDERRPTSHPSAHRAASISAGKSFSERHLAWGVLSRNDLDHLEDWRVIVLSNVALLDDDEVEAIRAYVSNGGRVYASKFTSLISPTGRRENFGLSDVFGCDYQGETPEVVSYLQFADRPVFDSASLVTPRPITIHDTQVVVGNAASSEVAATLTLPYTDPQGSRYASLLTDPPANETESPTLVSRAFGNGRVLYSSSVLEAEQTITHRNLFVALVDGLLGGRSIRVDGPPAVEVTVFRRDHDLVVHAVNFQDPLPNVPVTGVRIAIDGVSSDPETCVTLASREVVPWRRDGETVQIELPTIQNWTAVVLTGVFRTAGA